MLKSIYKNSSGKLFANGFTWTCDIRPSPINDIYTVQIKYVEKYASPSVSIIKPKPLQLAKGAKKLPHTYDTKKQTLCLFHPKYKEWNRTKPIATTIVHWAIRWIIFYEIWVCTGKWIGGGHGDWDSPLTDIKKSQ